MATETGMPEQEDVKKKALLRLALAGVITATALAGLWWLDQGGNKPSAKPATPASPSPIVPAPLTETAPPQTETPDVASATDAAPATQESPVGATAAPGAPTEPPPPPRVSNTPAPVHALAQTSGPHPAPVAPAAAVTPAPMPPQAAMPAPAPETAIPAGKGFVVQLGVFSNPDNARELLDKLNKQGIRAHLEARVQMGPFLNRREAERAQAEMRKLGYNALVTTSYPVK